LDNTIAYINKGIHLRLLQLKDRSNLKDYIQPEINVMSSSPQISNNLLLNLSNIPPVKIIMSKIIKRKRRKRGREKETKCK
jgi:hypothetical protein